MFTTIDYVIITIIGLSTVISLVRGFVREALSLATWGIAFWVAISFSDTLSKYLETVITKSTFRTAAAFAILFVGVLILGAIVNYIIGQLIDKTGLSGTDRALGTIFGFGRGLLFAALVLLLAKLTPLPQEPTWQHSKLIPTILPIENWVVGLLPEKLNMDGSQTQSVPTPEQVESAV